MGNSHKSYASRKCEEKELGWNEELQNQKKVPIVNCFRIPVTSHEKISVSELLLPTREEILVSMGGIMS